MSAEPAYNSERAPRQAPPAEEASALRAIFAVPETGDAHLAFWTSKLTNPSGYVYVVRGKPDSPIKVGYTAKDVRGRIAAVQTGCWEELRLLYVLPGPRPLEWQLHRKLRDDRLFGEWFIGSMVPHFLDFVADLADRMVAAYGNNGWPPDYRDFATWYHRRGVKGEVTVRHVEPTPVDPETAAARLAGTWMRPARTGNPFTSATGTTGTIN